MLVNSGCGLSTRGWSCVVILSTALNVFAFCVDDWFAHLFRNRVDPIFVRFSNGFLFVNRTDVYIARRFYHRLCDGVNE